MGSTDVDTVEQQPTVSQTRERIAFWTAVFAGVFLWRTAVGFFQWGNVTALAYLVAATVLIVLTLRVRRVHP